MGRSPMVALLLGALTLASGRDGPPDPRAAIFIARGCSACHAISALGLKAKTDVAPDLTYAYVDVVNRYGVSLEAFLADPRGVMRLMLAGHLHLTASDRDSIVHILHGLYVQHRAGVGDEIPPIDPDGATAR